jgi:hypothetical protein
MTILNEHGRPAHGAPLEEDSCTHGVTFDEEASKNMSSSEVRVKYPRFQGTCTLCGYTGIYYASVMHFLRGDW